MKETMYTASALSLDTLLTERKLVDAPSASCSC